MSTVTSLISNFDHITQFPETMFNCSIVWTTKGFKDQYFASEIRTVLKIKALWQETLSTTLGNLKCKWKVIFSHLRLLLLNVRTLSNVSKSINKFGGLSSNKFNYSNQSNKEN